MFLDGGEVVVQISYRVTLEPVESVCEAEGKVERVLAVSSTAFARMTVDAKGPAGWTDNDGCGPIVERSTFRPENKSEFKFSLARLRSRARCHYDCRVKTGS